MSDNSLRSRLEQLSEKELEQLVEEKKENPSLWQRVVNVIDRVGTTLDPQIYYDKINKRLAGEEEPLNEEELPSAKETPSPSPSQLEPPPVEAEPSTPVRLPGDVYRAQIVEVEPPTLKDFNVNLAATNKQKEALEAELAKLTPNRYEKLIEQGERDLSKLKVAPEVYQQYKDTLDQAYAEYKDETDRIRKAELWSSIAKALGYVVMARFSSNTLAPNQYGWKDFDANRYLIEAKNDLNAKLSIAKARLAKDQQAAAEERQLDAIKQRDKADQLEALEKDRLERKRDLERLISNLDQQAYREIQLETQRQNRLIQAYNMQVARNDRLFKAGEQADAKAQQAALRAAQNQADQLQKALDGLQKSQAKLADKLKAHTDSLMSNIQKVLENKKISDKEKMYQIDNYLITSQAFTNTERQYIRETLEESWFTDSIDTEKLKSRLNTLLETTVRDKIERLKTGTQSIIVEDPKTGERRELTPSQFVLPDVQRVIHQSQLRVVPTYEY